MGDRDDGLGLTLRLSLGFSQSKESSSRSNRMPLTSFLPSSSSSSFPHMHNHNNSHIQKIHHNSRTHLSQSSARNSESGSFLRGFDVNRALYSATAVELEGDAAVTSSPNSTVSSVSGNKKALAAAGGRGARDENETESRRELLAHSTARARMKME